MGKDFADVTKDLERGDFLYCPSGSDIITRFLLVRREFFLYPSKFLWTV